MARFLYSLLLYCLFPLVIVYLMVRSFKSKDYRKRWDERFGMKGLRQTDLLIHSVSMGETLAALPLIRQLQQDYPELSITVTTTSPTGSAEVIKGLGDTVQHCYLPFDFSVCIHRFLKQIKPQYLIIMETELWPNLVHFASKMNTKLMLANARLSEKSATQYRKRIKLTLPMLDKLDLIVTQSDLISERFVELGVEGRKVHVCGSLKFDLQIAAQQQKAADDLRQILTLEERFIWVAGSVHPGEFDDIINAHKQLLLVQPNALLIMVPRHPEQFNAAAAAIKTSQLDGIRRSMQAEVETKTQVLLGDTMGELLSFYGVADQAFVGGTLIENGGHNPLEPAALGLPVLLGPHYWDFAEIADLLNEAGALRFIDSAESLSAALIDYLSKGVNYQQASAAALEVVAQNKGALDKHLQLIKAIMSS
ncbi:lipid IV(A) 3-deoxy-D-manno-octulosonic acid transferase [Shewanella surugensis]|uniref:3-deoxy-D-manno-octulosonic acid transferase n=1 Tax=Shewanella surugensis TaxID=212020 RepID=A0ABT0LB66_9GAMM|nr:lipid IV(A) 3-deoxy-D-manno-octulosonic acid transferase [Shewanella surugensis]MCL1124416.1 lipid IV(A) 3-deoxy-D-manno-octulosonic acid transferase [Shewanella surugensis]